MLRRLRQWNEGRPVLYLTRDDLTHWQNQRAQHIKPSSLRGELSVLRAFYRWALQETFIDTDPTALLINPKVGRRLPRPMSDARYAHALEHAEDDMRAILGLAGWAGLRAAEIARLAWPDVDLPDGTLRVLGKGNQEGVAIIAPPLATVLKSLPGARRGPVIPRRDRRDGHNAAHTISHRANAYLHALGIPDTLHSLRHTFGTNLLRATGNLRVAQEGLRHQSVASTAIYTFVDVRDIRSAVELAATSGTALAVEAVTVPAQTAGPAPGGGPEVVASSGCTCAVFRR